MSESTERRQRGAKRGGRTARLVSSLLSLMRPRFLPDILPYHQQSFPIYIYIYIASTSSSSSSPSSSSSTSSCRCHLLLLLLLLVSSRTACFLLGAPLSHAATHAPTREPGNCSYSLFRFLVPAARPTDCVQIISRMPRVVPVRPQFVLVAVYRAAMAASSGRGAESDFLDGIS